MSYSQTLITWGLLFAIWGKVSATKIETPMEMTLTAVAMGLFTLSIIYSIIERKEK